MGFTDNKTKEELEAIAEKEEAEAKAARKAADAAAVKKAEKDKAKPVDGAPGGPSSHPRNGRRGGADRRFW